MRLKAKQSLCILAFGLIAICYPASTRAADSGTAALDVVLALDNSGSMKKNDPNSLMRRAVSEFASRLSPNSRLGIVLFDEKVRVVLDLTEAGGPAFNSKVAESLKPLDYRGRLTDIPGGAERAIYALRESGAKGAQKVIVLFTDGIVETGNAERDVERSRWLRESLAEEARGMNIRIFCIAFTEGADFQLLQSLAQATGGDYYRVLTAPDIPAAFEQISASLPKLNSSPAPTQNPTQVSTQAPTPASATPVPQISPRQNFQWAYLAGTGLLLAALAFLFYARSRKSAGGRPRPSAHLRDLGGNTSIEAHPLKKNSIRIGRDANSNDIVIPKSSISLKHAVIEFRDGAYHLRDLRSTNGTILNGKKFSSRDAIREVVLMHGDRIRLDTCEFEYVEDQLEGAQETCVAIGADVEAALGLPLDRSAVNLQPRMCPNHPSWKATDLCSVCQVPKCKSCLTQWEGRTLCVQCESRLKVLAGH